MIRRSVARTAVLVGAGAVTTVVIAVPRLLRLGATDEEARQPLPGDDEVTGAQVQGTRAITIDAPPELVWPWLAQIGYHGYGRAGWYALDLADNDGVPSAWEIIPEFQHPEVGQRVGEEGFVIRALESNRFLLLSFHYARTEWVRKQGLWPRFGSCSWAFVLRPVPGGRTRLITRARYRVNHLDLSALTWPFFLAVDLVLQPRMLKAIKRRVERAASRA